MCASGCRVPPTRRPPLGVVVLVALLVSLRLDASAALTAPRPHVRFGRNPQHVTWAYRRGLLARSQRPRCAATTAKSGVDDDDETRWAAYAAEVTEVTRVMRTAVALCREVGASMAVARDEEDSVGATVSKDAKTAGISTVKSDMTPVTAADFAIQGYVSAALSRAFPDDAFMGEEDAEELRADAGLLASALSMASTCAQQHGFDLTEPAFLDAVDRGVASPGTSSLSGPNRVWILDPIDGTKGLVTGQQYCVGLCLCVDGVPTVAGVANPAIQDKPIMLAVRDRGIARLPAVVTNSDDDAAGDVLTPRQSQLLSWSERSFDYARLDAWRAEKIAGRSSDDDARLLVPGVDFPPYLLSRPVTAGSPLPFGPLAPPSTLCCGALVKYWAVACGDVAGFIQFEDTLKAWDHAAGVLCVTEAGGDATDAAGRDVTFPDRVVTVDRAVVCCAADADPEARRRLRAAVVAAN